MNNNLSPHNTEQLMVSINELLIKKMEAAGLTVIRITPEQEKELAQLEKEGIIIDKQLISVPGILFSNAEKAVYGIRQDVATPAQWLAMLQKAGGIKAGEDKWLGLSEWLRDNTEKSLTKDRILDYIDIHRITLHEDAYSELEEMEEYKKLNEEFKDRVSQADELWHDADVQLEEFYDEMKVKYDDDWEYLMRDDERQREEELQEKREQYDHSIYDQLQRAFEEMVDKYGDIFDAAFGYENESLTVGDEETARSFFYEGIIEGQRLDHTTSGLNHYRELALWSEQAKPWDMNDTIHFGEVGQGRCIGWIRFGETTVQQHLTSEEYWQFLENMPKAEEWILQDGSKFVTGNDLYYPPSWKGPYMKSEYIAVDKKSGLFLYYPLQGAPAAFSSLQEAVDKYNREHVPQTKILKVLVIDEIQSNRHQKGREKGYQPTDKELETANSQFIELNKQKVKFQDDMRWKYNSEAFGLYMSKEEMEELGRLEAQILEMCANAVDNAMKIPVAPFEKNWHEVCMKRMLRFAAENGYDKLAWTTGEQQAKRYNLAKVVQTIERERNYADDKYLVISYNHDSQTGFYVKPDGYIYDSVIGIDGKHVNEVFGKELAEKALAMEVGEKLQANDLTVGNKGLITFYDRILPNFMNSYGKKWGIQVHNLLLPHLSRENDYNTMHLSMHCIDVTPQMKESVLQGQPMFRMDNSGTFYGCTMEGTIFLTGRGLNIETLVHEYTHVWATAMMQANPQSWQSIKDLLKGTSLWEEVKNDPLYESIRANEDRIASEALARISGHKNAHKLSSIAKETALRDASKGRQTHPADVLKRIQTALQTFWTWVGMHMFDIERFSSVEEVADRVLYDLLNANHLEHGLVLYTATPLDTDRITHIQVYNGRGGIPYIRCKVDGQQQMGIPVKPQDRPAMQDTHRLLELARQYFSDALQSQNKTRAIKI